MGEVEEEEGGEVTIEMRVMISEGVREGYRRPGWRFLEAMFL